MSKHPERAQTARLDLATLTLMERLWLWRGRRKLDQRSMAAEIGVSRRIYAAMEGAVRHSNRPRSQRAIEVQAVEALQNLARRLPRATRTDRLALARRRSGVTLTRLAAALGVSRVTVLRWEKTADQRLAAYWERRGYRLPVESVNKMTTSQDAPGGSSEPPAASRLAPDPVDPAPEPKQPQEPGRSLAGQPVSPGDWVAERTTGRVGRVDRVYPLEGGRLGILVQFGASGPFARRGRGALRLATKAERDVMTGLVPF